MVLGAGLALSATVLEAQSSPEIVAEAQNLSQTGDPLVIEWDGVDGDPATDRDAVRADYVVQFQREVEKSAEGRFRIRAQLLESGSPVAVVNGSGSEEFLYDLEQTITIGTVDDSTTRTFAVRLVPTSRLDPDGLYAVRVTLQEERLVKEEQLGWVTLSDSEMTTPGRTLYHFVNTQGLDSAYNVLADLNEEEWRKRFALETASDGTFSVDTAFDLLRFDDPAGPQGSDLVDVVIDYRLYRASDDSEVPLEDNSSTIPYELGRYEDVNGTLYPVLEEVEAALSLAPANVQLDSVNESFYVEVDLRHVEVANDPPVTDETGTTTTENLLHFNGTLRFGGIDTTFDALSNSPSHGTTGVNYVETTIDIPDGAGTVDSRSDLEFDGASSFPVRLMTDGTAVVQSGTVPLRVAEGADPTQLFSPINGIHYQPTGLALTPAGAEAGGILAVLPDGASLGSDSLMTDRIGLPVIAFGGSGSTFALTDSLEPTGDPGRTFTATGGPNDLYVEPLPLRFPVSDVTWDLDMGAFFFTPAGVDYVSGDGLNRLETEQPNLSDPRMAVKPSNQQVFRWVSAVTGNIKLAASDDYRALISVDLSVSSGNFESHFPAGMAIGWTGTGLVEVRDGTIDPAQSGLNGAQPITLTYRRDCPGDAPCGMVGPGGDTASVTFQPQGDVLQFTPDGGLQGTGTLGSPHALKWGTIDASGPDHAHETGTFMQANFLMAGSFLPPAALPFTASASSGNYARGPAALLLSGFMPTNRNQAERPFASAYEDGLADYAGLNFRLPGTGLSGESTVSRSTVTFALTQRSKYYVRGPGVTGIHEAQANSFSQPPTIGGYTMTFGNFAFSFLDSEQVRTRTSGAIDIPAPSDFRQPFERLRLSCRGDLEEADIPDNDPPKTLNYWLAEIDTRSIRFETTNPCTSPETWLVLGVRTRAKPIPGDLFGSLGITADGKITKPADPLELTDSRFAVPSVIQLAGAIDSEFAFNPVNELYFSAYDQRPQGTGFVTMAGTIDVPYFEDLQVQVQTIADNLAGEPDRTAPVWITGGWPEAGWTTNGNDFFNDSAFDSNHWGYPANDVTLAQYRSPTQAGTEDYAPRARQNLFGTIPLSYAVEWDLGTRAFSSTAVKRRNFLVAKARHQVTHLGAELTNIRFGAETTLPAVNLINMALQKVADNSGLQEVVADAAESAVIPEMGNDSIEQLRDLIENRPKELFRKALDKQEPEFAKAFDELSTGFSALALVDAAASSPSGYPTWNDFANRIAQALDEGIYDPNATTHDSELIQILRDQAKSFQEDPEAEFSIPDEVYAEIERIRVGINAWIGEVPVTVDDRPVIEKIDSIINENGETVRISGGPQVDRNLKGLLTIDPARGGRIFLERLVKKLIDEFVPPKFAARLRSELNTPGSKANLLLDNLFQRNQPLITSIVDALVTTRNQLDAISAELENASGGFTRELDDVITSARPQFVTVAQQTRQYLDAELERIRINAGLAPTDRLSEAAGNPFAEDRKEAFVKGLRNEIEDRFFATSLVPRMQVALKQRLYDVNAQYTSSLDSITAKINDIADEVVHKVVNIASKAIASLLGDLGEGIGSANIRGYAQIDQDMVRLLRLDADFQWNVPKESQFSGFLELRQYDSAGTMVACAPNPGIKATEVELGATDVQMSGSFLNKTYVSIITKFTFDRRNGQLIPIGLSGAFEQSGGDIEFEGFSANDLKAVCAFGRGQAYLSATAEFTGSGSEELSGGVFLGRTCTLDPISMWDPEVASILGQPPFSGVYFYGEAWVPLLPTGCLLNVSAGLGAGAFFFVEGPTIGGKMLAGISGEALCVVTITGQVKLIGRYRAGDLTFLGEGKVSGKAGVCPVCTKFNKTLNVRYDTSWHVSR